MYILQIGWKLVTYVIGIPHSLGKFQSFTYRLSNRIAKFFYSLDINIRSFFVQCIEKSYEAMRENQPSPLPEEAIKYCIIGTVPTVPISTVRFDMKLFTPS